MNLKSRLLFFILIILFYSCDKRRVFDEYKSVGKSWNKDSIVSFYFPKIDVSKSYNLFLNIRCNNDYPFNNLFLIVALEQPNKVTKVDTLEYQMSDVDGVLLGNGFTDIKESKLYYKEKMKFAKGDYKVNVKQAVRQTGEIQGIKTLNGITEVGFRIEKLD